MAKPLQGTLAAETREALARELAGHEGTARDTGRGIAVEDQARVFEPFELLETLAREHTPGVGLGLALVREMVATLGGTIALESTVGEGSTFTVKLPSRPAESEREVSGVETQAPR